MDYFVNVGVVMTLVGWGALYVMIEGIPSLMPTVNVNVEREKTEEIPQQKSLPRRLADPMIGRPSRLNAPTTEDL